ncbi:unnamed protein product [Urochloa decumbens]|uniref:SCP domain-containing protein n=1 Tax=Urochloa decumbens TaxID=240449 RepID=A0ABC9CBQ8_9POAL
MSSSTYLTILSLLALSVADSASPPSAPSVAIAAPPPRGAPRGPATAAQFLSLINDARADAGAPPLSWNATVAQRAKLHVSWLRDSGGCDLKQTSRDPIRLQMSMTWYQRPSGRPSPADAVATWLAERPWYDRAADACVAGKACGSYKILVTQEWRQLGCAMVTCPSGGGVAACGYRVGPGGKASESRELPY